MITNGMVIFRSRKNPNMSRAIIRDSKLLRVFPPDIELEGKTSDEFYGMIKSKEIIFIHEREFPVK